MKRVEKVSIGGYAFSLEEDAYGAMSEYIDGLRAQYSSNPDGTEIIEAFEDRIAELLLEMHNSGAVISMDDVDKIKETLGTPEAIGGETSEEGPEAEDRMAEKPEWWSNRGKKTFMRIRQGRVLGGVANGLAAYYGIDVFLMRALWCIVGVVGLVAGDSNLKWLEWLEFLVPCVVAAYVLLWVRTPEADGAPSRRSQPAKDSTASTKGTFGRTLGNIVRIFFGVLLIITGLCGIAAGVFALCGIGITGMEFINTELLPEIADTFPMIGMKGYTAATGILAAVCYFIPFIVILYEGLKASFDFSSPKWHPGLILSIIWIIACLALCGMLIVSFIPNFLF